MQYNTIDLIFAGYLTLLVLWIFRARFRKRFYIVSYKVFGYVNGIEVWEGDGTIDVEIRRGHFVNHTVLKELIKNDDSTRAAIAKSEFSIDEISVIPLHIQELKERDYMTWIGWSIEGRRQLKQLDDQLEEFEEAELVK